MSWLEDYQKSICKTRILWHSIQRSNLDFFRTAVSELIKVQPLDTAGVIDIQDKYLHCLIYRVIAYQHTLPLSS